MLAPEYLSHLLELGLEGRFKDGKITNPGGAKFWPRPNWKEFGISWKSPKFKSCFLSFKGFLWVFNRVALNNGDILYTDIRGKSYPHRCNGGLMLMPTSGRIQESLQLQHCLVSKFPALAPKIITGLAAAKQGVNLSCVRQLVRPGGSVYDTVQPETCLFVCVPPSNYRNGLWANQIVRKNTIDPVVSNEIPI